MQDGPRPGRPHPSSWVQWVVVGIFIVLRIPSLFDLGLAWLWLGFFGLVGVTIGLTELIAPRWVIQFRRSYLERASESQKRLGEAFDGFLGSPGPAAVQVIGCFVLAAGIAGLVAAGINFAH